MFVFFAGLLREWFQVFGLKARSDRGPQKSVADKAKDAVKNSMDKDGDQSQESLPMPRSAIPPGTHRF
eukprot:4613151-Amphidinium_carterae.1